MMREETERPLSHLNNRVIVASACLGGRPCRYNGESKPDQEVVKGVQEHRIGLACPENLGGLAAPHPAAEIQGGDGFDVLDGKARVVDEEGTDVTEQFIRGAERFLEFVRLSGASSVLLKSKSPSCGLHQIYDGTFTGTKRPGPGVAAALLQRAGIEVTEL